MTDFPAGVSFPNERVAGRCCRACGADNLLAFYAVRSPPSQNGDGIHSADVVLAQCETCALVTNIAFDETGTAAARTQYESAQAFADLLADVYPLRGRTVVEIGCGQGEFLETLCGRTGARGVGFDPAVRRKSSDTADVLFVADTFEALAGQVAADLIVCRHALERVADPLAFLTTLREHLTDTPVAFQVHDTRGTLAAGAFWDIQPEQCNYFTRESLTRVFQRAGFEVIRTSLQVNERFIVVEAIPTGGQKRDMPTPTELRLASQFVRVCSRRLAGVRASACGRSH